MSAVEETVDDALDNLSVDDEVAIVKRDWNKPWKHAFLKAYAMSGNISAAARAAGVTRNHVMHLRRDNAEWAQAMAEARDVAVDYLEARAQKRIREERQATITRVRQVKERAKDGTMRVVEEVTETETRVQQGASDALISTMLKANRPEVYGDRHDIRMMGADGGPVKVEVLHDSSDERMLELLRLARELEQAETIRGELVAEEDEADVSDMD